MLTKHSPSTEPSSPDVWGFYEEDTGSIQYVAACPKTKKAAIIDAVLDFEPQAARTSTESADAILDHVGRHGLDVQWILDTHPHADHVMASSYLKRKLGVPNAIGVKVREIAMLWEGLYNTDEPFRPESHFDHLFAEGDRFAIGELDAEVWLSPGHTLGSITYLVGDAAFVHDTFMYPDSGTSRADFPGGSSHDLWNSLQRILSLPDDTRLFVGHDYGRDGREPAWEATVAEHKRSNIHLSGDVTEAEYCKTRDDRDATLTLPDRMLHALQLNLRAGRLPEAEADGHRYLKIPMNRL